MSRATLEQDKKKTRAKDGPGAETDRKEREEYGEETDELEDDVPQGGRMSLLAHLNELRRRLTICAGRFDPAKARALNVPVPAWKLLQRGQSIPLENGAVVAPADVLGPARRGLRFVFSGDTAPCPALEQAAQNADLFLCDATYPDNEQEAQAKQWGHSTFAQGAAIAKKADVRRFWLMHYSPMILEPEAALPNAQAVFPAAECGFDGKQIILQYDEEAT